MKPEALYSVKMARIFYFVGNGLMIFCFFIFPCDLKIHVMRNQELLFTALYFFMFVITSFLFMTCGNDPGFLGNYTLKKLGIVGKFEQEMIPMRPEKELGQPLLPPSNDANNIPNDFPIHHYCEDCKRVQPYRTRHCVLCERCIHKFDHHCFWIGGCVGERNHHIFWIYLGFQTIFTHWNFSIARSGLAIAENSPEGSFLGMQDNEIYDLSSFVMFFIFGFATFVFTLFTGVFFVYHSYLISQNKTTWEDNRRQKINYLNYYPNGFHPFDYGLRKNIELIIPKAKTVIDWELPPLEMASGKTPLYPS